VFRNAHVTRVTKANADIIFFIIKIYISRIIMFLKIKSKN